MMAVGNLLIIMMVGYNLSPQVHAKGYSRMADPDTAPVEDDIEMNPADAMAKEKEKGKNKK